MSVIPAGTTVPGPMATRFDMGPIPTAADKAAANAPPPPKEQPVVAPKKTTGIDVTA